ncbi:MAG TPA: UDP-N-acetylglucosamine 2-epimerase (non-hydrolyzing) [Thermoplasmata archaeon]
MKIMTIFGTRPEIIRLSRIIPLLDQHCEHTLVHTGQNYDENLSDVFFRELGIRDPDHHLGVKSTGFEVQVGQILARIAALIRDVKPDRVLILGDTNSGLAAIAAARMGVPIYHIEGGNRCYDDRVPEEVNRRIIDACSTVLMAYTHRSKDNLLEEGVERERVYVIGNPIFEVLTAYEGRIDRSDVLQRFKLKTREYFAVTLHRTENVDVVPRLQGILDSLQAVHEKYRQPVIVSLHPRTADRMQAFGLKKQSYDLVFTHPLGLFDWVQLEKNARCVITDSGTLQDECSIFHVPIVTLRDVTERAETQEAGSNILAGANRESILRAVDVVLSMPTEWTTPPEYLEKQVSVTVAKILLGHLPFTRTRLQA